MNKMNLMEREAMSWETKCDDPIVRWLSLATDAAETAQDAAMINTLVSISVQRGCFTFYSIKMLRTRNYTLLTPEHVCYEKHTVLNEEFETEETIEDISESVDDLRDRLSKLKKMMQDKSGCTLGDISKQKEKRKTDVIDGNILSIVFGGVFFVVVGASAWAFFNLYHAVLKKFPSHHTEL